MPDTTVRQGLGIERGVVLAVALVVVCLVALRSTFGVSFYDDSHYVTVCLRLSQGARPFADEMSVQSLGFLPATAFVWLYTHLFGTTALVTAFRLFYVALATGVGYFAYSQLRRTFHPLTAALAVALPLMCPPFNLFAPGYNQMATIGFVLATALAHRAWLDRSRLASAGTGLALVFASITYPPLVVAAALMIVLLIAFTKGDKRVAVPLILTCLVASVVFVIGLLSVVSISDIRLGFRYASANVVGFHGPFEKLGRTADRLKDALAQPVLWPMWLVVVLASLPRIPDRVRAWLLVAIPVLATARSIQALSGGLRVFGVTAGAWLITFTLAAMIPVALWAWRTRHKTLLSLLLLTIPVSLIGFMTVAYATDSPWLRGVAVIGIVSAAIAVVASWSCALEELWGEPILIVAASVCLVIVLGLLWSESIDNGPPLRMTGFVSDGMYAGMHMTQFRVDQIEELEAASRRWVKPESKVTFYGERQAYLCIGGRIYTNAVWLYPSKSDRFSLQYFRAHGGMPDVIFTDQFALRLRHLMPYENAAKKDPLVNTLIQQYRMVEQVADFGIWVPKSPTGAR